MGNCTSKNLKENKKDMKEDVYRPCQSDTGDQNDTHGQGVQSTQKGIATQNSVETDNIRKETSDLKSSVDSKCHGSTEEKEQVKMLGKQESVEPEIIKSEVIKSQKTENKAMATSINIIEDKQSKLDTMDPKVKVSDMNDSTVSTVNDKQDYTEIKGKPYNFATAGNDKPDIKYSGFLDTKSGKTEPALHNDDIKTDGSDQSHDQKDEKGGDASDNKKDESGHSNLSGCDQNGKAKSNGSETGNHNSGQTNDVDSVPPESAPSNGDKSNQPKTGGEEFAFLINNEFKKDEKGKKDQNEVVKSKTKKKKDRTDRYVLQPGTVVQHHEYHEKIDFLNIGCDNVVVKQEKIEEKRVETTKTTTHSLETMNVLSEVAKSVGQIIGPKESGTCWRVGDDKIITAAHVVVDNIWDDMTAILFEPILDQFRVDFEYISKKSSSQFKVIPKVLLIDKSLDIAVLQLKPDEKNPFPPPLKMFHVLIPEKDGDKQIYLISHNQSKKKEVNSGIGIWKPTEKKLQDLEKFCQQYGEENGYIGLDKKDRLVIKCDFVGGASGSPGIVILNNVAYVVLVYVRGFPSFYHHQQFSEEQKRTFPRDKLFQHGVNIGNLFATMSSGTYIRLRNEIFPEEALKLEQTINQHKLAISGDKTSSNTETTETSTDIVKGKMDNISAKSETKIPISKATTCTDQSEDNIPDAANYSRLMSHNSVPGQTFITSPQEDTDRYNITGNQSAQDIKTGGSDKFTVQVSSTEKIEKNENVVKTSESFAEKYKSAMDKTYDDSKSIFKNDDMNSYDHEDHVLSTVLINAEKTEDNVIQDPDLSRILQDSSKIIKQFCEHFSDILADSNVWIGVKCTCDTTIHNQYEGIPCQKGDCTIVIETDGLNKSDSVFPNQFLGLKTLYVNMTAPCDYETATIAEKMMECPWSSPNKVPGTVAKELFKQHSNLTMVCPSNFKSTGFNSKNAELHGINCIQLFCKIKGIIPIGESHFPSTIDGVTTDVLEGTSQFSSVVHIGDKIYNEQDSTGTLGGFVKYYGIDTFLTCSHVIFGKNDFFKLQNKDIHFKCHTISNKDVPEPVECVLIRHSLKYDQQEKDMQVDAKTADRSNLQDNPDETSIDAALLLIETPNKTKSSVSHNLLTNRSASAVAGTSRSKTNVDELTIKLYGGIDSTQSSFSEYGLDSIYLNDNVLDPEGITSRALSLSAFSGS